MGAKDEQNKLRMPRSGVNVESLTLENISGGYRRAIKVPVGILPLDEDRPVKGEPCEET